MGEAFYEPIDDMGPERDAKAPEVLEPLADQWQRGGYDVRWLYRTILNTQAYQRRVRSTASAAGKTPFASGLPQPAPRRPGLRCPRPGPRPAAGRRWQPGLPAARTTSPARARPSGPVSLGDPKRPRQAAARRARPRRPSRPPGCPCRPRRPAPLAPGRPAAAFERLFGVDPSIANDDVLGTIPQALFMMNSPLVNGRIAARPGTVLGQILAAAPDERAALNALYLRVLSRQPDAQGGRDLRPLPRPPSATAARRSRTSSGA